MPTEHTHFFKSGRQIRSNISELLNFIQVPRSFFEFGMRCFPTFNEHYCWSLPGVFLQLRNLKHEGVIRTGNKGDPSVCLDMSRNCNALPSTS